MTFAIIRATITTVGVKRQIDPLWMYMWTSIELNVGKRERLHITTVTKVDAQQSQ